MLEQPVVSGCYSYKTIVSMVFAEDIRKEILKLADQRGPGRIFYLSEIAKSIDSANWMKQVERVQLVAETLVQEGCIVMIKSTNNNDQGYSKALFSEESR